MRFWSLGLLETVVICFSIVLFVAWIWIIVRLVASKYNDKNSVIQILIVALGLFFGVLFYILYNVIELISKPWVGSILDLGEPDPGGRR